MDDHEREKVRRILSWYGGKKEGPYKVDIELHLRCNLTCLSCSRRAAENFETMNRDSSRYELPTERWLRLVDEADRLEVREWHIAGGDEPLLMPKRALAVMERIKERGMYGIITTNGTVWRPEYVRKVVGMGWDSVHISIDGPSAAIHNYLRGRPRAFQLSVRTIKWLLRERERLGRDRPRVNLNTVLSRGNYQRFREMAELVRRLNVDYWFVEPLIVYSETGGKLKMGEQDIEAFLPEIGVISDFCRDHNIHTNFHELDRNLDKGLISGTNAMDRVVLEDAKNEEGVLGVPCYQPWWHMVVKHDGRVNFCDVYTGSPLSIKNQTLKEVWEGQYFAMQRNLLRRGELPAYCKKCNPSHTTQRRGYREEMRRQLSLSQEEIVHA